MRETPVMAVLPAAPADVTVTGRLVTDFFASRTATVGFVMLVVIVLAAVFAPLIAPTNPYDLAALQLSDATLHPGSRSPSGLLFWLGTDDMGRDLWSGILYGLRISLVVGLLSTAFAVVIGASLGLLAGYAGGWLDALIMRVADLQFSLPAVLIALTLLAILGQGVDKIILALTAVQWAYYARTVRSAAMVERQKEYIEAAKGLNLSHARIILRHLLPNCLPALIVMATVQVAHAISLEATLSFLGLGLPITEPSLGLLISNGFGRLLSGEYWISFFPGVALLFTVVAINLVADHLRDVLNPRLSD